MFFSNKLYQSKTSLNSRASEVTGSPNLSSTNSQSPLPEGSCYNDFKKETIASCDSSYPERVNINLYAHPVIYDVMVYRFCPESDEQGYCQYMCIDVLDNKVRECWTGQALNQGNSSILIYNTSEEKIRITRVKVDALVNEVPPDILVVNPKSPIRYRLGYVKELAQCPVLLPVINNSVKFLDAEIYYQDTLGEHKEKIAKARIDNICKSISHNGVVYISIP